MGGRAAAGIALASLSAIVACSLGDFSGYSDGDDPMPAGDGSVAETGAGGGNEAGPGDASVDTSEPPFEAGPDGETTGFCKRQPDGGYCEDFDGPINAFTRFFRTETVGGTLTIESDAYRSAPSALVATVSTNTNASSVYAVARLGIGKSSARLALSVRLDSRVLTKEENAQFLKIWFFANGGAYEVGLTVDALSNDVVAYEYAPFKSLGKLGPLAVGTWARFVVEVQLDGFSGSRAFVDRDGVRTLDGVVLSPPYKAGDIEAGFGATYISPNHGSWTYRIDDVTFLEPP